MLTQIRCLSSLFSPQQKVNIPECCSFQHFYVTSESFSNVRYAQCSASFYSMLGTASILLDVLSWPLNVRVCGDLVLGFLLFCPPIALHIFHTPVTPTVISPAFIPAVRGPIQISCSRADSYLPLKPIPPFHPGFSSPSHGSTIQSVAQT